MRCEFHKYNPFGFVGGNPLPLGGGRSLVYCLAIEYNILNSRLFRENRYALLFAKGTLCSLKRYRVAT